MAAELNATECQEGARRWVLAALAAAGALWAAGEFFFIFARHKGWPALWAQIGAVGVAILVAAIPFLRDPVARTLEPLRTSSARTRRITTLAIALLATLYLLFTARHQHRDLMAKEQDESMYLIQARMIAAGRLWMPAHAHPEFFESFNIFARPKYAAIYFPGTALLYAGAMKLHVALWMVSLLVAGSAVGMTYRVITELLDGLAGWLGAILLLGDVIFRHLSIMVMSHPMMLLQLLLMTWAWLRWRRRTGLGFALLLGIFVGWAAITRPLDALCFGVPLAAVFLWDLRPLSWRVRLTSVAMVLISAAPFLSLQILFDRQLTGHWLSTPVTMYHDQYWPQVKIGLGSDDEKSYQPPVTIVPEFKDYYDHYIWKSYLEFRRANPVKLALTSRVPLVLDTALPFPLLLVLAPLSVFALADRRRWPLLMALPLFVAAYASFMFFRKQYCVVLFPSVYLAILMGMHVLWRSAPQPHRASVTVGAAVLVVMLAALKLPEINRSVSDQMTPTPILHDANVMMASLRHRPALVFITYDPHDPDSWSQEPVYNTDVAWPDDAMVIRAHDLGASEDAKLVDYYAGFSPSRWVYLYDKSSRKLRSVGAALEVAMHPEMLSPP